MAHFIKLQSEDSDNICFSKCHLKIIEAFRPHHVLEYGKWKPTTALTYTR